MDLLSLAVCLTAAETASGTLEQNQKLLESIDMYIDDDGNLWLQYTVSE